MKAGIFAGRGSSNPVLGQRSGRKSDLKLLLVGFFDPNGLLTIRENIAALQRMSRHTIEVANLWPRATDWFALPATFNPNDYDGIIFHPTVSYNPENIFQIDRKISLKLRDYRGIKVLMKQDEQFRAGRFPGLIADKRFDLIVTCLAPTEWEKVYPRKIIGNCRIIQSLTGFVSPEMRSLFWREPAVGRPIDVGYRGSLQPLSFGLLGLEKWEIGHKFLKEVARTGAPLKCDISSRWEDRLAGQDWIGFLQNSRTTLGVESGSNLFDFDGRVEELCVRFAEQNQSMDPWSHAYYEKAYADFLHKYEGNVLYNQISPRHFEAAAAGSVQVLYEGNYSDIFQPWRHYIPLRKDFSNFLEIADAIRDDRKLNELATQAYEEIILNESFTYRQFVDELDLTIEQIAEEKGVGSAGVASRNVAQKTAKPSIYILASHDPVLDPRIEWWAAELAKSFTVIEIGFFRYDAVQTEPALEEVADGRYRVRIDPREHGDAWLRFMDGDGRINQNAGVNVLKNLMLASKIRDEDLNRRFGLFGSTNDRARFSSHLNYYVTINANLIEVCEKLGCPSAIVACDLDTLPSGVAVAKEWGIPLIYDAHEFWPFSFPDFIAGESSFWEAVERTLVPHTDFRICVTPQLSSIMTEAYGQSFVTVPNAVPRRDAQGLGAGPKRQDDAERVEFLYQGIFAPTRGIDRLVKAWKKTSPRCMLVLRGPEGAYRDEMRDLAAREGLLGSRIIFSDAVDEGELIKAASRSDIGIIPYEPANINNKFCCPNKLSQYMAAGLPILANKTEFVRSVLDEAAGGISVDFNDEDALVRAIDRFAEDNEARVQMALNAQKFFDQEFNWDVASSTAMDAIKTLAEGSGDVAVQPHLSWLRTNSAVRQVAENQAVESNLPGAPQVVLGAPSRTASVLFRISRGLPRIRSDNWRRRMVLLRDIRRPRIFLGHVQKFVRYRFRSRFDD